MTTELKNKWIELIEASINKGANSRDIGFRFNFLSQDEKDQILEGFLNKLDTLYTEEQLETFIDLSKIAKGKPDNFSFDYYLAYHCYNIGGAIKYLIHAIAFNWPELFDRIVDEINNYIIPDTNSRTNMHLSFSRFTISEIKEFVKICIEKISQGPDFEKTFEEYVAPYQLK